MKRASSIVTYVRCEHGPCATNPCAECAAVCATPVVCFFDMWDGNSFTLKTRGYVPPETWVEMHAWAADRKPGEWRCGGLSFAITRGIDGDCTIIIDIAETMQLRYDLGVWTAAFERAAYISKIWALYHVGCRITRDNITCPMIGDAAADALSEQIWARLRDPAAMMLLVSQHPAAFNRLAANCTHNADADELMALLDM